jgi:hypothetical protein
VADENYAQRQLRNFLWCDHFVTNRRCRSGTWHLHTDPVTGTRAQTKLSCLITLSAADAQIVAREKA